MGTSVRVRRLTMCACAVAACLYVQLEGFNRSLKPETRRPEWPIKNLKYSALCETVSNECSLIEKYSSKPLDWYTKDVSARKIFSYSNNKTNYKI